MKFAVLVVAVAVLVSGCSLGGGDSHPIPPEVATVDVSYDSLDLLNSVEAARVPSVESHLKSVIDPASSSDTPARTLEEAAKSYDFSAGSVVPPFDTYDINTAGPAMPQFDLPTIVLFGGTASATYAAYTGFVNKLTKSLLPGLFAFGLFGLHDFFFGDSDD